MNHITDHSLIRTREINSMTVMAARTLAMMLDDENCPRYCAQGPDVVRYMDLVAWGIWLGGSWGVDA